MNMKPYPDPDRYFEEHLDCAAKRYVMALQQAGLVATPMLTLVVAERIVQEIDAHYIRELEEIRDHNIRQIVQQQKRERRKNALARMLRYLSVSLPDKRGKTS